MTELTFEKITLFASDIGELSSLPPIAVKLSSNETPDKTYLDEDDNLFINYGAVESAFPYRYQDMYGRELKPTEYECAVLENENLRAVFMPCFGGKLWSLTDKNTGKELLYKNDVVRPCNLAVRNAWLAGGIEWNAGFKGHNPFTCSQVCTAKTKLADGTPVLRFYYFERIRRAVVQMDFFLPSASRLLFSRVRITNPNTEVIPMYWWSNVGVVENPGDRVVAPAVNAYTVNSNGNVIKINVPVHNGIDVTRPDKNVASSDFFWTTELGGRNYIAQFGKDGYGLMEASTSRLKGRKLFVWGDSQGGRKWKNFLTADDKSGSYDEIQCGLAHTQYECLPMPPRTVWEWLEGYGAITADVNKIFGDWSDARKETEAAIDKIVSAERLEDMLNETRDMAKSPAEVITAADGWGALEALRRQKCGSDLMNGHLYFGEIADEQKTWLDLLENGTVGKHAADEVPASYMRQKEWLDLLENAICGEDKNNWYAHYLLGTAYMADVKDKDYVKAEKHLLKSIALKETAWNDYAYAVLCGRNGNTEKSPLYMTKAYGLRKTDVSLAKEFFRCLYDNALSAETIKHFESAASEVKDNKRCLLYYAYALARTGRIAEAEAILLGADGKTCLVVPDVRECELTVTELWYYIKKRQGYTREQAEPPKNLDFRMFAARDGWI